MPWLFAGIMAEIALILFLLFRLMRDGWLVRGLLASMSFFSGLMAVLIAATTLAGEAQVFSAKDTRTILIAFVVLAVIVVVLSRVKEWGYANTPRGDRARARDALKPKKRKRPLIVDLLGCAVIGAVLIVLLVVGIAVMIGLFGRN